MAHSSQVSEASTLRPNGWDGRTCFTVSGIHFAKKFLLINFLNPHLMTTSPHYKQISIEDELTCYPEGSPVKMQASPNSTEQDKKDLRATEQDYGQRWSAPSMKSDLVTSSQKTLRIFSAPTMEEIGGQSSVNWMEWGTMQNGELQERAKSVVATTVPECTWLLTPIASDSMRDNLSSPMYLKRYRRSAGSLPEHLHRLGYRGQYRPAFPGWMMGFPKGWTESPFQSGDENQ